MVTNVLDYMYEGYGYDMDNQLLYVDVENYNKALDPNDMSTNGMQTLSHQGIISHEDEIDTVNANKYKEVGQFISENGANYTDMRQAVCGCKG